jgi:hypothetical protein
VTFDNFPPHRKENSNVKTVRLGKNGPEVSQLGLGRMAISNIYGPSDETAAAL